MLLCATLQRCHVRFIRNALAHADKSGRCVECASIGTTFAEETPGATNQQWQSVLTNSPPSATALVDP